MRFRTRTQEVEAIQWTGDNFADVEKFCHEREVVVKRAHEYPGMLIIDGHDDGFPCPGDYIVFELDEWLRGVQRGHKFEVEHEPVPDLVRTVEDYEGLPEGTILEVVEVNSETTWVTAGTVGVILGGGIVFAELLDEYGPYQAFRAGLVCSVVRLGGEQR